MTDKQIIIDGVDVSGCEHLYREIDCLAHIDFSECCEGYNPSYGYCPNIDCYYKELKRKEQECEELKKWLPIVTRLEEQFKSHEKVKGIDYKTYAEQVFTELDQLKAENEELKKEIHKLNSTIDFIKVTEHSAINKYNKLKQALTEIKEMCKQKLPAGLSASSCYESFEAFIGYILQKCEVIDEK